PLQADAFRGHCLSLRVLRTPGSQGSCYSRRSRRLPFQSTMQRFELMKDHLSQQMEYARLLGEMRPRSDPGVRQHEEAHQPPPESECIPFAVAGEKVFRYTFSHRFFKCGGYISNR